MRQLQAYCLLMPVHLCSIIDVMSYPLSAAVRDFLSTSPLRVASSSLLTILILRLLANGWLESTAGHAYTAFIIFLAPLGAVGLLVRKLWGEREALLSCLLLASSCGYFIAPGMSSADGLRAAAVTAAMAAFLMCAVAEPSQKKIWAIFCGLAVGLAFLSGGYLSLAAPALSVLVWACWQKQRQKLSALPWSFIAGAFLVLVLPVLLIAGYKSPGFAGTLLTSLGGSLPEPARNIGASWFYLLIGFFPWTPVLLWQLARRRWTAPSEDKDLWAELMLCWGLLPALLYSFVVGFSSTYYLPGLAGLAVYSAVKIAESAGSRELNRDIYFSRLLPLFCAIAGILIVPLSFFFGTTFSATFVAMALLVALLYTIRGSMMTSSWDARVAGLALATALVLCIGISSFGN